MSSINWADEPDEAELRRIHAMLQNEPHNAVAGLEALANRGSAMSMWYLANAYFGPSNIQKDICKAKYWYERAGQTGILQASHMLGRIFFDQKEYTNALSEFSVGAGRGYAPSLYRLGLMYRDGQGIGIDYEKCEALLTEAASKGHVFAKRDLMTMYLSGRFGYRQFWRGISMIPPLLADLIALKSMEQGPELEERIIC